MKYLCGVMAFLLMVSPAFGLLWDDMNDPYVPSPGGSIEQSWVEWNTNVPPCVLTLSPGGPGGGCPCDIFGVWQRHDWNCGVGNVGGICQVFATLAPGLLVNVGAWFAGNLPLTQQAWFECHAIGGSECGNIGLLDGDGNGFAKWESWGGHGGTGMPPGMWIDVGTTSFFGNPCLFMYLPPTASPAQPPPIADGSGNVTVWTKVGSVGGVPSGPFDIDWVEGDVPLPVHEWMLY